MGTQVLILDDNEAILELISRYLKNSGYSTLTCKTAESALEVFDTAGGDIGIVIADVTLSGASGVQTALQLHRLNSALKTVVASGYPPDQWSTSDAALFKQLPESTTRLLSKPFTGQELLTVLTELSGSQPFLPIPEPSYDALERQAGLLDLAHDAILVRDLEGRILYWNHGAETLYGWSKIEAIGKFCHDLFHTVFPEPFPAIEKTFRATGAWSGELRHTSRTGAQIVVSSRWAVRTSDNGRIEILEINRDISSRKQAERNFLLVNRELASRVAQLSEAEKRFRDLLESAPDAMVICSGSGEIVLVNAQTEQLFGYSRDELIGRDIEMLMPERFRARHRVHRTDYVPQPRVRHLPDRRDLVGLRKNGEEFPTEISLSPIHTAEGLLVSSAIRDVSDRWRVQAELARMNSQLEEAVTGKDAFLSMIGHDLRAPLHSIMGFADLLAEKSSRPLTEEQLRFVGHIQRDSHCLLELISDTLDLSRIRNGGLRLRKEVFDLLPVIEDVSNSFTSQLKARFILLETRIVGSLAVHADYERFKQLLRNILKHAVYVTPDRGRIGIDVISRGDSVEISVTDTGPRIPKDERNSLFDPFQQVAHNRTILQRSSGLSLSVAGALVECHGGRIWLEGGSGEGNRITFTIPIAQFEVAHAETP
jgi:protein-histidine pros-kinase